MRAADVFVLPSVYEGFGNAYLEAMACAWPCVALRNHPPEIEVASAEVIKEGVTGLIVDQNDPALLVQYGNAARADCAERFNWNRTVEQLIKL